MIETERLLIRPWRDEDREAFFRINSDLEVLRYLGPAGTRADTDAAVERHRALQALHGYCFWAVERRSDGAFLGFCGLKPGVPETPIEKDVEIGWRLGRDYWGAGFAREAAAACLDWAFAKAHLPRVAAITVPGNTRSWRLMERLGMVRRPDLDFLHPTLAEGDPLRPHITYIAERP